ncbi:Uncharacterised protein [Chromobacterium violaceum]|uniref:Uncharacterized protein n=1 Tax=Chromobacterium violaceum TaxID=536 RepID=A0A3S4I8U9_CHRVL|nr:Uncharacterised protein [Chromobacterium violaceum]
MVIISCDDEIGIVCVSRGFGARDGLGQIGAGTFGVRVRQWTPTRRRGASAIRKGGRDDERGRGKNRPLADEIRPATIAELLAASPRYCQCWT